MNYEEALLLVATNDVSVARITREQKVRRLAFTNNNNKSDSFVQVLKDGSVLPWQSTVEDRKANDWIEIMETSC